MLARGVFNELSLHGHYLFENYFIRLHRFHATDKQCKMVCEYIEKHADELLSLYPSKPDDSNDDISFAAIKMIRHAISDLGI